MSHLVCDGLYQVHSRTDLNFPKKGKILKSSGIYANERARFVDPENGEEFSTDVIRLISFTNSYLRLCNEDEKTIYIFHRVW